jgi:hypothetical protein
MSQPDYNMWDPENSKMQVAWDSVSLGALMKCPRYYQYSIVEGYDSLSEKIDLVFGRLAASGFERYKKARLNGLDKDTTILGVVRWALQETWNDDGTQAMGEWVEAWHCDGLTPYKNGKGNKAICPHAHKGAFELGVGPLSCGLCGSSTKTSLQYVPDNQKKNRVSLLRALVWWMLDQPEDPADGIFPYTFPDGTIAVEHSFTIPLPFNTASGAQYTLSGHLDDISEFGLEHYISDNKTTAQPVQKAAEGYSPHYQIDTYDLVGSILWPDLIDGVMIDVTQLLTDGVKFGRTFFRKTEALREEHLDTIAYWIGQAEDFAAANYWPMNKASCWNCSFKAICSTSPDQRKHFLKELPHREWNPLVPR